MAEFKKKKDIRTGCVPKRDFFARMKGKQEENYREGRLKAKISPHEIMDRIKNFSREAKMCVGDIKMNFEIGVKKIEVDNKKLIIRTSGLTNEEWKVLTEGYILTCGD